MGANELAELSEAAFNNGYDTDSVNELLYGIYTTHSDEIRQECIGIITAAARKYHKITQFQAQLKQFKKEYIQAQLKANVSGYAELTAVPKGYEHIKDGYSCGGYILNDSGVFKTSTTKDGDFAVIRICSVPLLILERLRNIQDNFEKAVLAFKSGKWHTVTVEREIISSSNKIVRLSNNGLDITSENAKDLVNYFQCLMRENSGLIKVCHTVNRLGWYSNEFIPYSDSIKCDTLSEFAGIYNSLHSKGKYDIWLNHCRELRENIYLRLVMAASFSAPLIEKIGGLPFITHIWGGTGAGKTVALNVAASIWGKPDNGLVRTLNGTDYGINETAAFLYSLPCILDELQTIKGGSSSYNQLIMRLTEGMNRTQGAAAGGIRQIKQWKNCFICSGEENIAKDNSGGGSVNRVIALEVEDIVVKDGNYTMSIIRNNYGYAGKKYINGLQNEKDLQEQYRGILKQLQAETDATDKQCMAMAVMLLANRLAVKYIFHNEPDLIVTDVKRFLKTKSEVDAAERCYKWVLDWIAQNSIRFESRTTNNGEVWGKIDGEYIMINKTVLSEHMKQAGFDYRAVISKWANKGYIERNSQGRSVHQTKVYNTKASYVKLLMNDDEYSGTDTAYRR